MNAKHTPGPWHQGGNPWNIISTDGKLIGSASFHDGVVANPRQSEEVTANAALMAASPALKEAVIALLACVERTDDGEPGPKQCWCTDTGTGFDDGVLRCEPCLARAALANVEGT